MTDNETFSFMPGNGCFDVQSTSVEAAHEKLVTALTDERIKSILAEYQVDLDWIDPCAIPSTECN